MTDTTAPYRPIYCSFCGKSEKEVKVLISATWAFICDECVAECVKVVEKKLADDAASSAC